MEDHSALTWQQEGSTALTSEATHHLLLLQRDGPREDTFLPVCPSYKPASLRGSLGEGEAKGKRFLPNTLEERENGFPVCIKIKMILEGRRTWRPILTMVSYERQLRDGLKAHTQESSWLCYLLAVWPWACYFTSLELMFSSIKWGLIITSTSFFVGSNLRCYKD